ncbi:MAG: carboxypeptidase-like regulatory domain-containing protein, partial [Bacteroidota bacterium]
MKQLFTLLAFLITPAIAFSQAEIVGTVVDTTGTTFPGANAVLLRAQDSLLTSFGTTDDKGVFRMQNVPPGKYLLRVTFLGYERPDQNIEVTPADQYFDMGDLKMYPAGFFLNGVEVTADRIPIRMKGDTMLYDADAFAVGENAVVEDLLRRLPGMSVDAAGNITWRGRPINEVMINGKPFFAGNTTLLTQNLDAKASTNVEVYDQKTDSEEITGVDDGNENMTVNLEMKDEFKAKIFGELYGGYGSNERYQAGGKVFRISDATQLGILGTINNINKVGFSGDEISGFNGSSGRGRSFSFGGGGGDGSLPFDNGNATGENRSLATGINFGQTVGKNGQLTADYALFDRNQVQTATTLEAFNQQNRRRVVETVEGNATNNFSHRLGFDYRHRLDTTSRLRLEGSASLIGGDNFSTANTRIAEDGVADDFDVQELTENERPGGEIELSYNRGLTGRRGPMGRAPRGRTFGVEASAGFQRNNNDLDLLTTGLDGGLALPGALVNGQQIQDRRTNTSDFGLNANFAEPLSDKWRARISAGIDWDNDEGDYRFRLDEETAVNLLDRTWFTREATASLVKTFKKGGNLSFGTTYESNTLDLSGDIERSENFNFLNPFIRVRKRTKKGFLSINLNTSSRAPSISQLQTIAQPGASGRVTIGNELLEPARNFRFNSFVWFNDQFRAISANANLSATYTDNAFGNEVSFEQGQQVFKTINIGHAWQGNAFVGSTIGMNFISGELRLQAN